MRLFSFWPSTFFKIFLLFMFDSVSIIFFLISNKDSLISKRERHPSTPGVYRGEQIKNENYKSQVNPKEKKKTNGFSKPRTIQVRFGKKEAWCRANHDAHLLISSQRKPYHFTKTRDSMFHPIRNIQLIFHPSPQYYYATPPTQPTP